MDVIPRFMEPVARSFPWQASLYGMIVGDRLLDHVDPLIGAHMRVVEVYIAGREFGELEMELLDPFRFQRRARQFGMPQSKSERAQTLFLLPAVKTRPVGGEGAGQRGFYFGGTGASIIYKTEEL